MNKYQKQAAIDVLKLAGVAIVGSLLVQLVIANFTVSQIAVSLAVIVMVYCGYNLFQIRVSQLETLDKLNNK
jgi:hypothetical protein